MLTAARTRAAAALAVLAAASLTACASSDAATPGSSSSPATETAQSTAPAAGLTVETATGPVELAAAPQRIVVLEHGILDTIDALGGSDVVAGIPHHVVPDYLASYTESAANVGTLFEPDYEAINAAEPDLIIVGGRSVETLPEMEKIAPTIDLSYGWGTEPFLESLERNVTTVGQLLGAQDEAAAALAEIEEEAAAIAEDAADAGTGLVVLTSGGQLSAYGPSEEGRYDFFYSWLGVTPAAEQVAIDTHGDAVSYEFLADTNPDIMVVLDRDGAIGEEGESAQALLDNELVNGTTAAQNGAIAYVDTQKWYLSFGGLTALDGILDEVGALVG